MELVGYNPRARAVFDVLHVFGDCLTSGEPGFDNDDFHRRIEDLDEVVGEQVTPIVLRGRSLPTTAAPGEQMIDVLRRTLPDHRDLLLATEDELRHPVPLDIPEVLRLEEWHQPVFHDVLPSETETYQLITDVLATGDPGRYRPTLPPNTHRSHWPDSGTLLFVDLPPPTMQRCQRGVGGWVGRVHGGHASTQPRGGLSLVK
ncbi:DUF7003 family protein [Micromonospora echinaurantiaca]|uniref:DUF7003 family protein n=1 Tax=Micromonospora echinaurantiaca TaxID=47857 RepID=UPI00343A812B